MATRCGAPQLVSARSCACEAHAPPAAQSHAARTCSSTPTRAAQALHVAALRRSTAAAEALIAAGAQPDAKSRRGWTPLEEALAARDHATAKACSCMLRARLASPAVRPGSSGCSGCTHRMLRGVRPRLPAAAAGAARHASPFPRQPQVLHTAVLAAARLEMKAKRRQLLEAMRRMPDYTMAITWRLGSPVPVLGMLLRRYAPADTYTLWKVRAARGLG